VVTAYLGLGANLGERDANINRALVELVRTGACRLTRVSSVYETDPVGIADQPDFLNAAAAVETALPPHELLRTIRSIERGLGREKTRKWGPRHIDIDILLYGDMCVTEGSLEIPHPEMHRRAFVLVPLTEIAPAAVHPRLGCTVEQMSADIGSEGVRKYIPPVHK
jgi:2-amino-4-hydroxy-6-hydroxymethyldihydropteridine diphosphokinase